MNNRRPDFITLVDRSLRFASFPHALYTPNETIVDGQLRSPALRPQARGRPRARQAVPSLPDESGVGFALKRFAVRARAPDAAARVVGGAADRVPPGGRADGELRRQAAAAAARAARGAAGERGAQRRRARDGVGARLRPALRRRPRRVGRRLRGARARPRARAHSRRRAARRRRRADDAAAGPVLKVHTAAAAADGDGGVDVRPRARRAAAGGGRRRPLPPRALRRLEPHARLSGGARGPAPRRHGVGGRRALNDQGLRRRHRPPHPPRAGAARVGRDDAAPRPARRRIAGRARSSSSRRPPTRRPTPSRATPPVRGDVLRSKAAPPVWATFGSARSRRRGRRRCARS